MTAVDDRATLVDRLQELEEENAKLRDVEDQFWILLKERDELQTLLRDRTAPHDDTNRSAAGVKNARSGSTSAEGAAASTNAAALHQDKFEAALHECLDLLIAKDRNEQFDSRGPVAAFLAWCDIEQSRHDYRSAVNTTSDAKGTNGSKSQNKGAAANPALLSPEERETFLLRIRQLENEQRQLQDELDRADVSRLQALEDADRLHQHVAALSEKLIVVRDAATNEKLKADKYAASHSALLTARAQLADKDAEIARLKAEVEHLRRIDSVGGAELAADAARIREELAKRSASSPSSVRN